MNASGRALALAALLLVQACAADAQERVQPASGDSASIAAPARGHDILAWPFYVRWDGDGGSAVRMVGPLSGTWRAPRHRATYLLFPTTGALSFADGREERWLAWPLTGYRRDPRRGITEFSLVTPLVGYRRQESEFVHSVALNPLWSDSRWVSGARQWQLSPLMYRRSDPARQFETTEIGVAPFLGGAGLSAYRRWSARDSHGWSAAIFWGQRSDGRGGATSLLPYVSSWRRDSVAGDSRFRALVPVWAQWRNPRHQTDFLLPAWWRHRSPTLNSTGAWPFYASFRRTHGDSTHHAGGSIVWPLVSWGSGEDYSAFGMLPLWYRVHDGDTRVSLVPPVFGRIRRPGLDAQLLLPVHLRWWGARDSLTVHLLWYRQWNATHRTVGLFALFDDYASDTSHRRWVFPSWYQREDSAGTRRMLVPFWGRVNDRRSGDVTTFYGPLVTLRGPRANGNGIVPVWYSGRDERGTTHWLGPWFQRDFRSGAVTRALVPLAWYERSAQGSELHMLPLTGRVRRASGYQLDYLLWPLWSNSRLPDGRTRASLLLWLGRDERREGRHRNWLQPLWYFDRTGARSSYLALLGGLLASYEATPERTRLKVLLVPVRTRKAR